MKLTRTTLTSLAPLALLLLAIPALAQSPPQLSPVGIWPLCRISPSLAPGCAALTPGTESYIVLYTPVYSESVAWRWTVKGIRALDGQPVVMSGYAAPGDSPVLYPGALIGATVEVMEVRRSDGTAGAK